MTLESLFIVANSSALVGWILLILLPKHPMITGLVLPVLGCGMLALLYLAVMVRFAGEAEGGFTSLDDVESLFQDRGVLLAGWIHYLVFDLFIGCWEVRDARRLGISHWLVIPVLLLTLMMGPIGLLTYFVIRFVKTGHLTLEPVPSISSALDSDEPIGPARSGKR